jgi:hypothetical protein
MTVAPSRCPFSTCRWSSIRGSFARKLNHIGKSYPYGTWYRYCTKMDVFAMLYFLHNSCLIKLLKIFFVLRIYSYRNFVICIVLTLYMIWYHLSLRFYNVGPVLFTSMLFIFNNIARCRMYMLLQRFLPFILLNFVGQV